jgi:fructokinase
MLTTHVQRDAKHATGTVPVRLDAGGEPEFTITRNVAWDFLEWTPQWRALAGRADAVCFGSLAQRSTLSHRTIQRFLRATRTDALRVFDVNLRQQFYSAAVLTESLQCATLLKLNDEELPCVTKLLKVGGRGETAQARRLLDAFHLDLVCVTRGARGCLLATAKKTITHPGFKVAVADTVGAGDGFTAALVHLHLRNAPLEKIAAAANRLGAWVASQEGAMPPMKKSFWRLKHFRYKQSKSVMFNPKRRSQ